MERSSSVLRRQEPIRREGKELEVKEFKYLGSTVSASDEMKMEVNQSMSEGVKMTKFWLPVEKQRCIHHCQNLVDGRPTSVTWF